MKNPKEKEQCFLAIMLQSLREFSTRIFCEEKKKGADRAWSLMLQTLLPFQRLDHLHNLNECSKVTVKLVYVCVCHLTLTYATDRKLLNMYFLI